MKSFQQKVQLRMKSFQQKVQLRMKSFQQKVQLRMKSFQVSPWPDLENRCCFNVNRKCQ